MVHISDHGADRLYLVFDEVQVSSLAFYFGIAPLTAVFAADLPVDLDCYVMSRGARFRPSSSWLKRFANYDFRSGEFEKFCPESFGDTADSEVVTLVNAFKPVH